MIKNHLSRILGERRWTQAKLARETGIRPTTINHLYHEFSDRVSFDQLDLICEALDCSIADLLESNLGFLTKTDANIEGGPSMNEEEMQTYIRTVRERYPDMLYGRFR